MAALGGGNPSFLFLLYFCSTLYILFDDGAWWCMNIEVVEVPCKFLLKHVTVRQDLSVSGSCNNSFC